MGAKNHVLFYFKHLGENHDCYTDVDIMLKY